MRCRIAGDPLWAEEYARFVDAVSFAALDERLGFQAALESARELVALFSAGLAPRMVRTITAICGPERAVNLGSNTMSVRIKSAGLIEHVIK